MREGWQVGLKKRQVGWKQSLALANFTIRVQALFFAKESLNRLAGLAYFINFNCPAECVRQSAFLNTGDRLVEPFGDFSSLTVVDHKAFVFPDQLADGGNDSGGSGAECFLKQAVFVSLNQFIN